MSELLVLVLSVIDVISAVCSVCTRVLGVYRAGAGAGGRRSFLV